MIFIFSLVLLAGSPILGIPVPNGQLSEIAASSVVQSCESMMKSIQANSTSHNKTGKVNVKYRLAIEFLTATDGRREALLIRTVEITNSDLQTSICGGIVNANVTKAVDLVKIIEEGIEDTYEKIQPRKKRGTDKVKKEQGGHDNHHYEINDQGTVDKEEGDNEDEEGEHVEEWDYAHMDGHRDDKEVEEEGAEGEGVGGVEETGEAVAPVAPIGGGGAGEETGQEGVASIEGEEGGGEETGEEEDEEGAEHEHDEDHEH